MKKIKIAPSLPEHVEVNELGENRSEVIAYPFESGYAITLAHPMRRLILGSSVGYAPISIKIEGAAHEFDSIRGMHEDVAVFIINLKNIRFRLPDGIEKLEISYKFSGPRNITAVDLISDEVNVVNPEAFLATLNEDAELNFSVVIAQGLGYVQSEDIREVVESDYIALDAFFTPVKKANYEIANVLVEDNPNYEKIVFDIETDGQISPVDAFTNALETMYKQLSVFNGVLDVEINATPVKRTTDDSEIKAYLEQIDSLGLSARSFNSLDRSGIYYVGELVLMNSNEIKNIKNLGKKSLDEIAECLDNLGYGDDFELADNTRVTLVKKIEQLKESAEAK
jgi:DNA-directed RNA polymerase subunit alpha